VSIIVINKDGLAREGAKTFDNFKNPVACFEGPGSIFRERLEPRMKERRGVDAHG
jgi:hypothetical protein